MKEFLFKKISREKGLVLILIAFLIAILIIIQQTKTIRFPGLITGFLGTQEKATLSLSPSTGTYKVGDEFSVNVYLNTKENNVVGIGAYINYSPTYLRVVSIATTSSVFNTGYEIINYNGSASHTPTGTIEIIKSKPSPGVNTSSGLVVTIRFKALSEVNPSNDNVTFSFTGAYDAGDSDVILDDGQGTDILSGVDNGKYVLSSVTPTPTPTPTSTPPPSGGGGGGGGGDTIPPAISDIKMVAADTYATISWKTSESSISWLVYGTTTAYGLEIKTITFTTSHSLTLTKLSASTTCHYQIKSKDALGNIGSYTDQSFTTLTLGGIPVVPSSGGGTTATTTVPQTTLEQLRAEILRLLLLIAQLQAQLAKLTGAVFPTPSEIPAGFSFQKNLYLGMSDQDVVYLKIILSKEGCISGLQNTQYFGSQTTQGVKCFCQKYKEEISRLAASKVSCSGSVGKGIRAKLNQLLISQ